MKLICIFYGCSGTPNFSCFLLLVSIRNFLPYSAIGFLVDNLEQNFLNNFLLIFLLIISIIIRFIISVINILNFFIVKSPFFSLGTIQSRQNNAPKICHFEVTVLNLKEKQPPEVFCKKSLLKNFVNFTGKHLWWSLFNKVAGLLSLQLY